MTAEDLVYMASRISERTKIEHKLFLKLFGRTRDVPAKILGCTGKSLVSLQFEGRAELLAPTRSSGRPPPHPKKTQAKKFGLGSFSSPTTSLMFVLLVFLVFSAIYPSFLLLLRVGLGEMVRELEHVCLRQH